MRTPSPKKSPRAPHSSPAKIKVRQASNTNNSSGVFATLSRAAAKLTNYMSPSKRPLPSTPTGKTLRREMASMRRSKVRNNAKARLHAYEYNKSVSPRKISFENNRVYNKTLSPKKTKKRSSIVKRLTRSSRRSRRVAPSVH
jgi:hypothetical protein